MAKKIPRRTNLGSGASFPTTRWTRIQTLSAGDETEAERALETLCEDYRAPLLRYVRQWGYGAEDAEDFVQSFLAEFVHGKKFTKADSSRGRLRTFLLTALRNSIFNQLKGNTAKKRGAGSTIVPWDEVTEKLVAAADESFDIEWAKTVMENTLDKLQAEFAKRDKEDVFEAIRPFLGWHKGSESYAEIATSLDMTPQQVSQEVYRMRQKFARSVRDELRDTVDTEEGVEEELRYFVSLLEKAGY